ncbi:MAG: ribose-phosphate diphosphokinase [Pseudomonadota bacterium]
MAGLLFSLGMDMVVTRNVAAVNNMVIGQMDVHHFPDGETLIRIMSDVSGKDVALLCTLNHPDEKTVSLMFFADTVRDLGAKSVRLIAPYLGYMRQDKRFHEGEAVTSDIYAAFLSRYFDGLITVDPHLHRHTALSDIYTIPTRVVHAAEPIAAWILANVENPVLIGPDEESAQWVSDIAQRIKAPSTVQIKIRLGDEDVKMTIPRLDEYRAMTPVLMDDIISTATTMVVAVNHIRQQTSVAPVCIGVHPIFAGDAYQCLVAAVGTGKIVTCNTIHHPTNEIDISHLLVL